MEELQRIPTKKNKSKLSPKAKFGSLSPDDSFFAELLTQNTKEKRELDKSFGFSEADKHTNWGTKKSGHQENFARQNVARNSIEVADLLGDTVSPSQSSVDVVDSDNELECLPSPPPTVIHAAFKESSLKEQQSAPRTWATNSSKRMVSNVTGDNGHASAGMSKEMESAMELMFRKYITQGLGGMMGDVNRRIESLHSAVTLMQTDIAYIKEALASNDDSDDDSTNEEPRPAATKKLGVNSPTVDASSLPRGKGGKFEVKKTRHRQDGNDDSDEMSENVNGSKNAHVESPELSKVSEDRLSTLFETLAAIKEDIKTLKKEPGVAGKEKSESGTIAVSREETGPEVEKASHSVNATQNPNTTPIPTPFFNPNPNASAQATPMAPMYHPAPPYRSDSVASSSHSHPQSIPSQAHNHNPNPSQIQGVGFQGNPGSSKDHEVQNNTYYAQPQMPPINPNPNPNLMAPNPYPTSPPSASQVPYARPPPPPPALVADDAQWYAPAPHIAGNRVFSSENYPRHTQNPNPPQNPSSDRSYPLINAGPQQNTYGGEPAHFPPGGYRPAFGREDNIKSDVARPLHQQMSHQQVRGNSSKMTSQALPMEKIIADVSKMGFSHQEVQSAITSLEQEGEHLDLNKIIDRLVHGR